MASFWLQCRVLHVFKHLAQQSKPCLHQVTLQRPPLSPSMTSSMLNGFYRNISDLLNGQNRGDLSTLRKIECGNFPDFQKQTNWSKKTCLKMVFKISRKMQLPLYQTKLETHLFQQLWYTLYDQANLPVIRV
jgi:hypothetical protein